MGEPSHIFCQEVESPRDRSSAFTARFLSCSFSSIWAAAIVFRFRAAVITADRRRTLTHPTFETCTLSERHDHVHARSRRRDSPHVAGALPGRMRKRNRVRLPRPGPQLFAGDLSGVLAPRSEYRASRRARRIASHCGRNPPPPRCGPQGRGGARDELPARLGAFLG